MKLYLKRKGERWWDYVESLIFKATTTENRNKLGFLKSNYVQKIEENINLNIVFWFNYFGSMIGNEEWKASGGDGL